MVDPFESKYRHLGNHSATPPWHSRWMCCDDCMVSWEGCWDNFMCPECGMGELPTRMDNFDEQLEAESPEPLKQGWKMPDKEQS